MLNKQYVVTFKKFIFLWNIRRQLLDDDQQQVSALKEMLLEDGELHSDSGRKRKFQWGDTGCAIIIINIVNCVLL